MAYVTKIEAAIKLGYSVELLDYLSKNCPKKGGSRVLRVITIDGVDHFDDGELIGYQNYLNQPWPLSELGKRPHIPKAIEDDIKAESHFSCAICGYADNGEVAHIEEVSKTRNNSPDNLIFLCPNHHTKYDYGYKPSSNVTLDVIRAAKEIKRNSRQRILLYESNATKSLQSLLRTVSRIESAIKSEQSRDLIQVNVTELKALIESVPELTEHALTRASEDREVGEDIDNLVHIAPSIAKAATSIYTADSESQIRKTAQEIISHSKKVVIDIDEVECPHCGGRGQTGLVGDLCVYCKGSCYVSTEMAENYDEDDIDEVECPRCGGSGQTGLIGDLCTYCKGSCVVTGLAAESYDEDDIDEVECPRCGGSGQTGLVNDLCAYCKGSCFVSTEMAESYDEDDIDEVECPRCGGSGQTGLKGDLCKLCKGSTFVDKATRDAYLEEFG